MRCMWGDYDAGECWHGEPAATCPACHPTRSEADSPWLLVLGALLCAAWVVAAPAALDRELANDEAQARRHRERVERHAPHAPHEIAAAAAPAH